MQSELDAKVAEYEQSIDKLNELVRGGTTAMRLSLHKKYVSSLQQDIYRIKGLMAHKREEIETQLQKVIDATKEVSKLEKLEEKQLGGVQICLAEGAGADHRGICDKRPFKRR